MLNSRRACLKLGVLTGAVLSLPILQKNARATHAGERAGAPEGAALTRSLLAREVDTRFVVWRGAQRPVALRLTHVGDPTLSPAPGAVSAEECFSATFEGAEHAPVAQGTYRVTHDALGELLLFLVPVGPPGRVRTYELSVNRRAV
jgi:hypothetical protein